MSRAYHHGDLRRALVDVAIEIIDQSGAAAFSVAEACRRLNVSPGAPYRHFSDRNDLMVEIAIKAMGVLAARVTAGSSSYPDPLERLARAVNGYVLFAAEHPALFEIVFSKEVHMGDNPRMREATRPVAEAFVLPIYQIRGISDSAARHIIVAAGAIAHGYGVFLSIGNFPATDNAVSVAAERAGHAVRALVMGPKVFPSDPNESSIMLAGIPLHRWIDEFGVGSRSVG